MEALSLEQLKGRLAGRTSERLVLTDYSFADMDLSGMDLSDTDLSRSLFKNVTMDQVNFSHSLLKNICFDGCPLPNCNFAGADLSTSSFRGCDLSNSDLRGANLFRAVLERADLTGIKTDDQTKWYKLYCPASGPFVAFKKCLNDRIVQLLVPADAMRSSATGPTCRCSKAKVLKITNFAQTEEYDEAWSLVDPNFVYRRGQWVQVDNFNQDRWYDSTTGIHFWMTREEAMGY